MHLSIIMLIALTHGNFEKSTKTTIHGYFNHHQQLLVPVDELNLSSTANVTISNFSGDECGTIIRSDASRYFVFDLNEYSLESIYLLKVSTKTNNLEYIVKTDLTPKNQSIQIFDNLLIAGIAMIFSLFGYVMRSKIENTLSTKNSCNLFRKNLVHVAIDLYSGSNVADCITRQKLILNIPEIPSHKDKHVYLQILKLIAEVEKLTNDEAMRKRTQITDRYFDIIKDCIVIPTKR